MTCIQLALRSGYLGESNILKAASKCELPMCPTCKYAKAKRRPTGYQGTKMPYYPSYISNDILRPGKKVIVDHFIVREKGRLWESKGKTPDNVMYSVKLQVHINVQETVAAKLAFERELYRNME